MCVLVAGLWTFTRCASLRRLDRRPGARLLVAGVTGGCLFVTVRLAQGGDTDPAAQPGWINSGPLAQVFWFPRCMLIGPPAEKLAIVLPFWVVLAAFGPLTTWLWWRDWRANRWGPGQCAACGYDLAGLDLGATCPECGKAKM